MLVISREINQTVLVGADYSVKVRAIMGGKVLLHLESATEYWDVWTYPREPVEIYPGVFCKVLKVLDSTTIRLGVEAPREVPILRKEISGQETAEIPDLHCDSVRGPHLVRGDDLARIAEPPDDVDPGRGPVSRTTCRCCGEDMGEAADDVPRLEPTRANPPGTRGDVREREGEGYPPEGKETPKNRKPRPRDDDSRG